MGPIGAPKHSCYTVLYLPPALFLAGFSYSPPLCVPLSLVSLTRCLTPLTASVRFIPVWNQLEWRIPLLDHASLHSHNHTLESAGMANTAPRLCLFTLPQSHTPTLPHTPYHLYLLFDQTKGTQDKDFSYSFSDSHSLSHSLTYIHYHLYLLLC